MELKELLEHLNRGERVINGSEAHRSMSAAAYEAMELTARLNSGCHGPDQIQALFSMIIGKSVDRAFTLFPRLRQKHYGGKGRVHQFRVPLSGSGRHHHRRGQPDWP